MKFLIVGAALLVAASGSAFAQDKSVTCKNGVEKLKLGLQVIGASDAQKAAAQGQLVAAQTSMGSQDYNGCLGSVVKGITALDAG